MRLAIDNTLMPYDTDTQEPDEIVTGCEPLSPDNTHLFTR